MQPGNACVIAFLQANHARAASRDDSGTFMAGDKRQRRLCRPIALGGMQVSGPDCTSRRKVSKRFSWASAASAARTFGFFIVR